MAGQAGQQRQGRMRKEKSMKESIIKRLGNLLSVKSIVTLVLTGVFAYMAVA